MVAQNGSNNLNWMQRVLSLPHLSSQQGAGWCSLPMQLHVLVLVTLVSATHVWVGLAVVPEAHNVEEVILLGQQQAVCRTSKQDTQGGTHKMGHTQVGHACIRYSCQHCLASSD